MRLAAPSPVTKMAHGSLADGHPGLQVARCLSQMHPRPTSNCLAHTPLHGHAGWDLREKSVQSENTEKVSMYPCGLPAYQHKSPFL